MSKLNLMRIVRPIMMALAISGLILSSVGAAQAQVTPATKVVSGEVETDAVQWTKVENQCWAKGPYHNSVGKRFWHLSCIKLSTGTYRWLGILYDYNGQWFMQKYRRPGATQCVLFYWPSVAYGHIANCQYL